MRGTYLFFLGFIVGGVIIGNLAYKGSATAFRINNMDVITDDELCSGCFYVISGKIANDLGSIRDAIKEHELKSGEQLLWNSTKQEFIKNPPKILTTKT